MYSTRQIAVGALALAGVVALCSYSSPSLSSGAVRAAAKGPINSIAAAHLKNANPAKLAQIGGVVNKLVGSNASPKDFRKLAEEVACVSALRNKQTMLGNAACANVEWYGPNRQIFLPGKSDVIPEHLKGELPGDFGFDPLNLGEDDLAARASEELYHGRWAMLGAAGILTTDLLSKLGVPIEGRWWKVGSELLAGKPIDYLGNPNWVHASNFGAIFLIQFFLMAAAEVNRGYDESESGSKGMYPGGNFDPLGFAKDETKLKELKIKEIKNGRLAMMAMLGFYSQAFSTGKSPLENLGDHISNPFVNHI
ncbi:hypothetical protein AAMO2058_000949200 [Amorphochlora amoebiformis]|mmetsp:Transcript_29278/g.46735  ORF Transcript_29278/g.46735 Transcript_29278/m.46735 type:complete len:309 (-) Transcript_29278:117-1043(-)